MVQPIELAISITLSSPCFTSGLCCAFERDWKVQVLRPLGQLQMMTTRIALLVKDKGAACLLPIIRKILLMMYPLLQQGSKRTKNLAQSSSSPIISSGSASDMLAIWNMDLLPVLQIDFIKSTLKSSAMRVTSIISAAASVSFA